MNATAKNSMHHEPNPKFGHEIECAECFELFPGPMDANVGDTITCTRCKSTLYLADVDGDCDDGVWVASYRWEVKSTPAFCPTCGRSHCGCAAYITPAAEPHHGSEASPQQESTNPRSTSSTAPEVMDPAGVSFEQIGTVLFVTFPCEDCSRDGFDFIENEFGETVRIVCPTCEGKKFVTMGTDETDFQRLWCSFKDRRDDCLALEALLEAKESEVNASTYDDAPYGCTGCSQRYLADRLPKDMRCWACSAPVVERKTVAA